MSNIATLNREITLPLVGTVPLLAAGGLAVLAWFIFLRGRKPKRVTRISEFR